ncbi:MAG: hypothetical protein IPJ83_03155 [Saprospiraceae bacterium]|nr:hypothetical protein [Candidatus Vicinibacter proximus]MCC6841616.1 hypothetical protein [Saprospiraceae bacterium]HRG34197.1 hypothetical protein [Saprospiraceae bacterium]
MRIFILLVLLMTQQIGFGQGNLVQSNESYQLLINKIETKNKSLFLSPVFLNNPSQSRIIPELRSINKNVSPDAYKEISTPIREILYRYPEYLFYHKDTLDDLANIEKSKPFLKYLYHNSHFYSILRKSFYVLADPMFEIKAGVESFDATSNLLTNRRGIKIAGGLDNRIFFNASITETQIGTTNYVGQFIKEYQAFPGAGFLKIYDSKLLTLKNSYDYLIAEGNVHFNLIKSVHLTFGHGRNKIGNGIRSLFLSDFSSPYLFLKINSQFGPISYQNLFAELSAENRSFNSVDRLLDKKYMASHFLNFRINKRWNFGIFESVIFGRKNGFELQYLNPVILYRGVEQSLGSPDNVLLGFQSEVIACSSLKFYGQMLFDEFVLNRIVGSPTGWWGNKYSIQLGLFYFDFLRIKNLDVQAEFNSIRPYTYSFRDSVANYSHNYQSLAHPLGSNFNELIFRINYQPSERITCQFNFLHYVKGNDKNGLNFGGNILKSNAQRVMDFNNQIGQGEKVKVFKIELNSSYRIWKGIYLDLDLGYRFNQLNKFENSYWMMTGLRMNLDRQRFDF